MGRLLSARGRSCISLLSSCRRLVSCSGGFCLSMRSRFLSRNMWSWSGLCRRGPPGVGGVRRLLCRFGLVFVCDAGWFFYFCFCFRAGVRCSAFAARRFGFLGLCAGIREAVFAAHTVWFICLCAGIRVMPSCFTRRPCAGRHLLFFAAAKKSRQKKAANTANISSCLRAPNRSYASHGNHVTHVRCQRSERRITRFKHPRCSVQCRIFHCRPGGKLCVGRRATHASLRTR